MGRASSKSKNEAKYAIKAYKIPIATPKDLVDSYFLLKKRALEEVFRHVKYSRDGKKAYLRLGNRNRKRLRNELLKGWRFAAHYVDSAIESVIGLVKGWIRLYNRGKARRRPRITRRTVYVKSTLFRVRDGKLRITIEPRRRYLEVNLTRFDYLPKDYDAIGGLIMDEKELIIAFKKKVVAKAPEDWASFDVNLMNITGYIDGKIIRYDLRELYHIHRCYEEKRRRIQRLSKRKPKTARKLMRKYSRRERNRVKDTMHKLTSSIARMLAEKRCGVFLEDLKGIKERKLNRGKDLNRKISKWNARTFQRLLDYKLKWLGLPVRYVDPAYSSKICPLCSGRLTAYGGRKMKCSECGFIEDRDVVAALNLQMWGLGVAPKGGEAYDMP